MDKNFSVRFLELMSLEAAQELLEALEARFSNEPMSVEDAKLNRELVARLQKFIESKA